MRVNKKEGKYSSTIKKTCASKKTRGTRRLSGANR